MLLGHGVEVPNAIGQFGGLPGSCGVNFIRRDAGDSKTIAVLAANLDEMVAAGVEELGPKPGHILLSARDVLGYAFQGGGGYGDPAPNAIRKQYLPTSLTVMSPKKLRRIITALSLKTTRSMRKATARCRDAIRIERLGGGKPKRPLGEGRFPWRPPALRMLVQL